MSAITGIFHRNGHSVSIKQIKKMNDILSHRGPDGSQIWCDESVAFGHQMLYTTHESLNEELPFEDVDSGLIITSDARIDNRKELAPLLGLDDLQSIPDSKFILKAYHKWGEKSPEKLLGDFAFAIWDPKKKILFCARDHMGVKPFYYYLSDDEFIFATEMKALFAVSSVPHKLNEQKIAAFLLHNEGASTFYEEIHSLGAATSLTISRHSIKYKNFWEIDADLQIILDSDEDYVEHYNKIFKEAISCRLRSAFPVGFELSGGLDSSSLVCMVKKFFKHENNQLNTFSLIFNGFPKGDETHYVKRVSDNKDIQSHFIPGESVSFFSGIDKFLRYQEQPYNAPFLPLKHKSYETMRNSGIRVLFSGTGGDHVVSYGQNYLKELALTFHWKKLFKEIKAYSNNHKKHFGDVFFAEVVIPLLPSYLIKMARTILRKPPWKSSNFLSSGFLDELVNENLCNSESIFSKENKYINAKEFHYKVLKEGMEETLEMLDRGCSAHLIEPRYPYLDKRLVEFCYAIPSEMKFKLGWPRYIQRVAMGGILPAEIQWRSTKGVIGDVLQNNLLKYDEKRLNELFNVKNKHIEKYVNLSILKQIYKRYKHETTFNRALILWKVLLLSIWLEQENFYYR